jgi:hypothetical protein
VDHGDIEDQPRTASEVAERCLVLFSVVAAGHKEQTKDLVGWLRSEGLWHAVSPREAAFLEAEDPTRQQQINATWRAESLLPLLWALGRIQGIPDPSDIISLEAMQEVLPPIFGATSEFVARAALRPEEEIWDVREATYQAHWAVVDARINGRPAPDGLNAGVLYERHHALNWLIGYCGQDWDDVTTDT